MKIFWTSYKNTCFNLVTPFIMEPKEHDTVPLMLSFIGEVKYIK